MVGQGILNGSNFGFENKDMSTLVWRFVMMALGASGPLHGLRRVYLVSVTTRK